MMNEAVKNVSVEHDLIRALRTVGLRLVKAGEADAFVSPGNTGAVMANSLLILGRIEGVLRT